VEFKLHVAGIFLCWSNIMQQVFVEYSINDPEIQDNISHGLLRQAEYRVNS